MKKIRQFWGQFFKITGIIFTIKELLIIFGVPIGMTTGISAVITQFFADMSWGYRIPLLAIVLILMFVGMRYVILYRKRRVILNKQALINALAEFELQARNIYTGKGNSSDYQKACDDLHKEMLVADLADGNNPISELIVFATVQVAWKQGQITGIGSIYYFKTPLEFVGSLRGKAIKTRRWIEIISR